jgi:hypothetical protein
VGSSPTECTTVFATPLKTFCKKKVFLFFRNRAAGRFRATSPMMSIISQIGSTMAVTQADIDNLNAAIASGVRSVTLGGQTVIYSTRLSRLIKARNDLEGTTGGPKSPLSAPASPMRSTQVEGTTDGGPLQRERQAHRPTTQEPPA